MSNYGEAFEGAIATEMRAQKARKNLTEASIADQLGIHRVSVSRYLSGVRPLPLGVFADLCRVLDLNTFEVVNIAEIAARKALKARDDQQHGDGDGDDADVDGGSTASDATAESTDAAVDQQSTAI